MTVKPFSEDLLGGECMSLVWISKAVISHIEEKAMSLSVFYYYFVIFLVAVAVLNQLYVIIM